MDTRSPTNRNRFYEVCYQFLAKRSLWLILLLPFAYLFRVIVFIRKRLLFKAGRPENFTVPIVVIGNITVGGSGKTPLTITIANKLVSLGYKPGIVSRGYQAHAPHYPFSVKSNGDATSLVMNHS